MYPAGVPERGYQLSIIRTALLNNTLVCLPTGLGKTLIAAVVMYNFTRWFPEARSWHAHINAFILHAVSDAWMCRKPVFLLDLVTSTRAGSLRRAPGVLKPMHSYCMQCWMPGCVMILCSCWILWPAQARLRATTVCGCQLRCVRAGEAGVTQCMDKWCKVLDVKHCCEWI